MGLLSSFKRQSEASVEVAGPAEPDAVGAARTRARRRLIGATVLLGLGVIGFPLLFETQPRPIPVNIPIEIPRKDGLAPLTLPPAAAPASAALVDQAPAAVRTATAGKPPTELIERAGDQGRELPSAVPPTMPVPQPVVATPAPSVPVAAAARPPAVASKPAARLPADDGARVRALLDGQASASAPAVRMVVQVGAYADAAKLAEARQKLEKLGLKTYTQELEVDGAKRTRLRVGPFASRADADKAATRIKAAGLPVAILTL